MPPLELPGIENSVLRIQTSGGPKIARHLGEHPPGDHVDDDGDDEHEDEAAEVHRRGTERDCLEEASIRTS